jgi:hypothetical protein
MKIADFYQICFNGFHDISNYKKNDAMTVVLAVVKTFSCFTVVILLAVAGVYGVASLYGRVSKKDDLSPDDKSVNDKAKTTLFKKDTPITVSSAVESSNRQLAESIIAARGEEDQDVKAICSGKFLADPIAHLIHEMIKRGAGRARLDDGARAFVISKIPGFIEKVGSLDYLREFAEHYFDENPNKTEILQFFETSLSNVEFQIALNAAVEKFNSAHGKHPALYYAENSLRTPLTIYPQSARLKEYACPEEAGAE